MVGQGVFLKYNNLELCHQHRIFVSLKKKVFHSIIDNSDL